MLETEQFPLFRLVTLIARQMAAPIASRIKEYARGHPAFSRSVCMRVARRFHSAELRFKMWSLRLPQPRHTPTISDQQALNTGADILGEAVIFGLGAAIIVFEVNRQALKQEAKEEQAQAEWAAAALQLDELRREVARQQARLDRLQGALRARVSAPVAAAQ